jgi:hypothetical protein
MTQGPTTLHTLGCAMVAATVLGCAATPTGMPTHAPAAQVPALRVTQRGHGVLASFELHAADALPQPTPKTLATRQPPSRVPSNARDTPRHPPAIHPPADRPATPPAPPWGAGEPHAPQRPP